MVRGTIFSWGWPSSISMMRLPITTASATRPMACGVTGSGALDTAAVEEDEVHVARTQLRGECLALLGRVVHDEQAVDAGLGRIVHEAVRAIANGVGLVQVLAKVVVMRLIELLLP